MNRYYLFIMLMPGNKHVQRLCEISDDPVFEKPLSCPTTATRPQFWRNYFSDMGIEKVISIKSVGEAVPARPADRYGNVIDV